MLNRSYGTDGGGSGQDTGDHVSKLLATMVLGTLEEYQKANPDWPRADTVSVMIDRTDLVLALDADHAVLPLLG